MFKTLFAASFALTSAAALANPHSVRVSYADLDLARPAGVAALETRIGRAATSVCAANGTRDLTALMAFKACRANAIASAASPMQVAIAAARDGRQLASLDIERASR